jgi:Methyltransferase domain
MKSFHFEKVGWGRTAYAKADLDLVQRQIIEGGFNVQEWDLSPFVQKFSDYIKLPEYAGSYREYGGKDHCSFLEKALEHFLSFKITQPAPGNIFVDVGSCVSVVPEILRRYHGCDCYVQDLELPPGVHGWNVGSNAAEIPLPDASIDGMTLHCTFEHFEGKADSQFVRECARLLKTGGKAVILPLYVNLHWTNITGEIDEDKRGMIQFDDAASYFCVIPEWHNRFGRHYSSKSLLDRVLKVAFNCGLNVRLLRVINFETIHPDLWLKWIVVLEKA